MQIYETKKKFNECPKKRKKKKLEEKNTIPICDELTVCFLVQKKKSKIPVYTPYYTYVYFF